MYCFFPFDHSIFYENICADVTIEKKNKHKIYIVTFIIDHF